ncbi:MAG: dephospho-CoA kinase [Chthoniobacterales bacterium]
MPAIGITGGIATGKTTFCRFLRELMPNGVFFDADKAARVLTDSDSEVQVAIRQAFGPNIYSESGDLKRAELRAIILTSAAKREALEKILHPRIRSQWSAEAQRYRNSSDFFFADIPLLYETGGETLCDRVVVVACSEQVQLRRLMQRGSSSEPSPGTGRTVSEAEAIRTIQAQMPVQEKASRADHVMWNNDGEPVLAAQAADLVRLWTANSWTQK